MGISANRLAGVVTKIGNDSASVIRSEIFDGTVASVSPLRIMIAASESRELPLPAGALVLSPLCKAKTITVAGETVRLWGDLVVGEKVTLMSYNAGQRYFVERSVLK